MDASLSLIQFVRVIREYTRRHNQLIAGICKKPGYLSAHSMQTDIRQRKLHNSQGLNLHLRVWTLYLLFRFRASEYRAV